jgi:hypothetical protein
MTSTPATLALPFFTCCVEKGTIEKLSEINAFAGLMCMFGILLTFLICYPISCCTNTRKDDDRCGLFEALILNK